MAKSDLEAILVGFFLDAKLLKISHQNLSEGNGVYKIVHHTQNYIPTICKIVYHM